SPTSSPSASPTAAASPSPTETLPPNTGLISGTLTYDEPYELSADARAVVFLIEVTVGADAGTVITSTEIRGPGAQPIAFELAYPFAVVDDAKQYQVFGGIVDGDAAWASPTGVAVPAPQAEVTGVQLELEYRPDLLKGAVTGSITGDGLGPITDPDAYGTSILIDTATGATVGFQLISPIVAQPIPFSAPFDTSTIDPTSTYVARGSVWDGTTLWNTPTGTAVITGDNPKSGIVLTVVPAVTTAPPEDPGRTWLPVIVVLLALGIGVAVFLWWRARRAPEPPDGPATPPPPPGPDTPPPPPAGDDVAAATTPGRPPG
ncbi:MAG TPA: YbaY family lipoprotein, partial [Candidatus Limnocylindrales bacterium]|nr:YbaY family lipoprotein [Candidatus Limnocylindrales bacterium]